MIGPAVGGPPPQGLYEAHASTKLAAAQWAKL